MSVIELSLRRTGPARAAVVANRRLTWSTAIAGLVLVIWLIPIKRYTLPVNLPFHLEVYRLYIILLLLALLSARLSGRLRLDLAGHGAPLIVVAAVAICSQITNSGEINRLGLQTQSFKSLSFFLSFLVAFVLVTSTLRTIGDIERVVVALVAGAFVVSIAAIYESRTHHNIFNNLHHYFPLLRDTGQDKTAFRGGLRVRASAQQPIAFAAAMLSTLPLCIYLARHAASRLRSRLWLLGSLLMVTAAVATVSRTAVLMLAAIAVIGLAFRGKAILRRWPLLIVLVLATHFSAPGAIKHLYKAFHPKGGIISQQEARPGQQGSGRLADIHPGLNEWKKSPVLGHGLGTSPTLADPTSVQTQEPLGAAAPLGIIFDDQYLNTLVSLGIVGLVAVLWFLWGGIVKLGRAARAVIGRESDFFVACTASLGAYATGMVTLDAFSFVQVTLLAFVILALGLRAQQLLHKHP